MLGARGLYELLLSEDLERRLQHVAASLGVAREALRPAEAADRIAFHVGDVVRRAIADLDDDHRVVDGIALARRIVAAIGTVLATDVVAGSAPVEPGTVLHAICARLPDGTPETLPPPLIPLLDTALLTNAPHEPHVGSQILAGIASADRIDVVMAFVRRSGVLPLLDALRRHCTTGRRLRVLTTTYTGSTEQRALDDLQTLGGEVRVSYDTSTTRLHAKAWLFHRESSFSTAYIGSSNLTHSAQVTGLEWNVRVSGARNPTVVGKVATLFEAYSNNPDFARYDRDEFAARCETAGAPGASILLSPVELRLEPFQERLLEQIELARSAGHHRNLLAAATGTGKTVMAAVDYARLRARLPRARLLFVAHREELLLQSRATFCQALRDAAFGELWVGGERPRAFEHVFASIQSLHANGLAHLDPRHFDIVVVDEFHHAAAASCRRLLEHVQPVELLGLTATPERSDDLPILHWFDGRIAAELRLWDAIDQHRLAPFLYYGIADGADLREVPWRRGRGYDIAALSGVLTASDGLGNLVVEQVRRHVDAERMRALGFCVGIEHARFMARIFTAAGIAAVAVWADTPELERRQALLDLQAGRVRVVFAVDLFNEGVDVPAVDTLLFLRPTDSPTLFLQQLGRGLRRAHGKAACTVLDLVGQHRREFRFDRRLRALLGGSRKQLEQQIEAGFPFLPAGCNMQLDPVAKERVLRSVRDAIPREWAAKAAELRQLATARGDVTLAQFLDETGFELVDVYAGERRSWSELRETAGLRVLASGEHEPTLRRACGRLLHVDDHERLDVWRAWLRGDGEPAWAARPEREQRLLRMLVASVADQVLQRGTSVERALASLRTHPQVCAELAELCDVLVARIDHLQPAASLPASVPLAVHARYSRLEILAAMGIGTEARVAAWQSGVHWVEAARADLLAFTLDKTSGQFSPTTSYQDRALSRERIQWESQSVTRADSDTGRRYQRHVQLGTSILLFARLHADDRAFWFLGPATYERHEGERPMSIVWRLHHPLPGDLFAQFAAAVA